MDATGRAMLESMWTAEEATAWDAGLKRPTTRRYRLEGSRAGNSRLVSLKSAEKLKAEFGGEVVELIPPRSTRPRIKRLDWAATGFDWCPVCGAAENTACVTTEKGRRRKPHAKRPRKET